ncbi:benzoylformate decarboxylase [Aquabacter sediminis]|uniref:benzoylformate decarboxylase n=1 Tax=Aquabacter sediminis TaxID=3029197 RepID=UPI00237E5942|nr:benzoylformate decarboxylase [Aquabacter sp. P-9]MDE1567385.1 benzoylformate decarboxylase [Aquabacter sp. P-9]
MVTSTVRTVTHDLLRKLELTTFFGNPGSTEETFLKDFPSDFTYHLALQEASAIAIADGYAQATGKPAIVNVHTAAGLGNAMGNLITASLNKTPLIVTAGQQTREMLLMEPWLTNVDSTLLPRPWVKWAYEPARAEDVPAAFMRAYATALQAPAGPVFLSLPLDDWDKPMSGEAVLRTVSRRVAPDFDRLKEFAQILSQASSPALIFGAAIDRGQGWPAAVALAEKLGATVWAAPASERAPFPEDHPLFAGGLPFAIAPLCEHLKGHDVAIVIGAPVFRYYPYVAGDYLPAGLKLLHISDDPAETARAPVGDSLVGDAVLATQALVDLVAPRSSPARTSRVAPLPQRMAPHKAVHPHEPPGGKDGIPTAADVFAALAQVRPAHAVLVEESPSNLADLHRHWPITEPATFFTFASGGLGWNLPASVGIALGERDTGRSRPVIVVIGDGSMQYSIQSLWTAAQSKLPIVFIALRNGQYGILKSFAVLEETPGVPGLDIPGIDIVSLAKGYGCASERISDLEVLKTRVAEGFTGDGPLVIEVPITADVPPLI